MPITPVRKIRVFGVIDVGFQSGATAKASGTFGKTDKYYERSRMDETLAGPTVPEDRLRWSTDIGTSRTAPSVGEQLEILPAYRSHSRSNPSHRGSRAILSHLESVAQPPG